MAAVYDGDVELPGNNELNHLQVHRQLMAAVYDGELNSPIITNLIIYSFADS